MMDVFISHSAQDRELAHKLRDELVVRGFTCFLAPKGVQLGQDFAEEIRAALLSSRVLCLLATRNSLGSEWVTTEWGAAWVLGSCVIPVLLRCSVEDLPERLRRLQCIDFHDIESLAAAIRSACVARSIPMGKMEILPYSSADFRKYHREYLDKQPSEILLLSYTGETTDGLLLTFEEMALEARVRLLVRDWTKEEHDETQWNKMHPERSRDWTKARCIREVAQSLSKRPWSAHAGGKIELQQKYYCHPPSMKLVLYAKGTEPYAAFFGFYRYDPAMQLCHPSIYVDVGQPVLRTEQPALLRLLAGEFEVRWQTARTMTEIESIEAKGARDRTQIQ